MDSTMLFSAFLSPILHNLWWFLPLVIVATLLKTPLVKGWFGEAAVRLSAGIILDKTVYRAIHNVALRAEEGTTQIDHVFVSRFGIFVVETKNMKGWIYGSERDAQWTQNIYGKKTRFQNPLHQNYKHTKTLSGLLDISEEKIHSVIAFMGDSKIKTDLPANVTSGSGFARYIKSFKTPVFSAAEVVSLVDRIQSGRLEPTLKTHFAHVEHVRNKKTAAKQLCPKCGGPLVLRTARSGANAGGQFWGCSNFPRCSGTRPA